MKKLYAICILSLFSTLSIGQDDSVVIYHWSDLKSYNPDTIFGLSFEKMKLDKIPAELKTFKNLRTLNLSKNKLTDLPDYIGELNQLKILDISRNKFAIFPVEICRLNNLQKLLASRNLFDKIPECIGFCSKLEIIDLWDTPIMSFPNSMENLKNLKEMDLQGIKYGPTFQKDLQKQLSWVFIKFDAPCDCME